MTYAEIEEIYPEEAQLRKHDKLAYRYPRCVICSRCFVIPRIVVRVIWMSLLAWNR